MRITLIWLLSFLLPVILITACGSPFKLDTLTEEERDVVERIDDQDFSSSSLKSSEMTLLVRAAKKYLDDHQPLEGKRLLDLVTPDRLTDLQVRVLYHYGSALIALYENDNARGRRSIIRAVEMAEGSDAPPDVMGDLAAMAAPLYRSMGLFGQAFEFALKAEKNYRQNTSPAIRLKRVQNLLVLAELVSLMESESPLPYLEQGRWILNRLNYSKMREEGLKRKNIRSLKKQAERVVVALEITNLELSMDGKGEQLTLDMFDSVEKMAEEAEYHRGLARIWLMKSRYIERVSKNPRRGSERKTEALILAAHYARKSGDRLLEAVARHSLAKAIDCVSDEGIFREESSFEHLHKALELFELVKSSLITEGEYSRYYSMMTGSYESYMEKLVLKGKSGEALEIAEMLRSRSLRKMIAERKVDSEMYLDPVRRKKIASMKTYRDFLLRKYMKASMDFHVSQDELKRTGAKIRYMDRRINKEEEKAILQNPAYSYMILKPVTLSEIQSVLKEDQVLIYFHLKGKDTLLRWVIKEDSVSSTVIPLAGSIDGMVDVMLKSISSRYTGKRFYDNSHFLFKRLFSDLLEGGALKGNKLLIAPHRSMGLIPFDALVTCYEKDKPVRYLLDEKIPITVIQSLTVFVEKIKNQKREWEYDFVGFADPDYGGHAAQLYQSKSETRRIARLFPRSTFLTGRAALESRFKNLELSRYRYVHLSTHGNYLQDTLKETVVLFDLVHDTHEDGVLAAREVYELEVRSELVSMSACNTALGRRNEYEGIIGFTHAFFTVGTGAVMLTLWPVNANSAEMLFVEVYRNIARGKPFDEALYRAKVKVRRVYPGIGHWAPLVLNM